MIADRGPAHRHHQIAAGASDRACDRRGLVSDRLKPNWRRAPGSDQGLQSRAARIVYLVVARRMTRASQFFAGGQNHHLWPARDPHLGATGGRGQGDAPGVELNAGAKQGFTGAEIAANLSADLFGSLKAPVQRIGGAFSAVQAIAETIESLRQISLQVSSAVQQQGSATREISQSAQQASAATGDASSAISTVMGNAEGTRRAASELLQASSGMSEAMVRLDRQVEDFLKEMHGE